MVKIIGLIPARSGSKRVPRKNMAMLAGKPLLQYAIDSAKAANLFDEIVVTSNWDECLTLAKANGVRALLRPAKLCRDESHDFEFVEHALARFKGFDAFVILRPTSPFRTGETIRRAWGGFTITRCDSMRAVHRTPAHPRKSWYLAGERMKPYVRDVLNTFLEDFDGLGGYPGYDMPTQALGDVYVQNGCIHIAWVKTVERYGNVSGKVIAPFFTGVYEGIDINGPLDLILAEAIMEKIKKGGITTWP